MVEGNVIFNRKNTILMKNLTKTLIMAVLPLMFFGLFTCQPESDPAIYQAESFMDVYPDSAFLLLKNKNQLKKLLIICTKASRSVIPAGSISSLRATSAEAV